MALWRTIERIPGLAAVTEVWRRSAGADFEYLHSFLRPMGRLASRFPSAGCDCEADLYRVVSHGVNEFVGVCDSTGERVELARQDLVIYELDRRAFFQGVALALGVEPEFAPLEGLPESYRIGAVVRGGVRVPVYLTVQFDLRELPRVTSELAVRTAGPFLILAPTRDGISPAIEHTVSQREGRVLALGDILTVENSADLRRTAFGEEALADFLASAPAVHRSIEESAVFRKSGRIWELAFDGRAVHLEDSKGLGYLARLLAQPGRSIHVAALLPLASGAGSVPVLGSRGESLDAEAMKAYKERILDLQERLAEAEEFGDLGTQESLSVELDTIVQELSRATGLGGRSRQNTDADRLRKSISNAISRSLEKVSAHHPALGRHLGASIALGQFLTYAPPSLVAWAL